MQKCVQTFLLNLKKTTMKILSGPFGREAHVNVKIKIRH